MIAESPAALPPEQQPSAAMIEPVVVDPGPDRRRRWSPIAVAIWVLFAAGLALFIAFARVPIEAGWRHGRSMRVLDIWSLFTLELVQVAPWITPALATGAGLVVLAGALICLWLAMSVAGASSSERPD